MNLSREQIDKIELLSDNQLYREANKYAAQHEMPENSQLNGLMEYTHNIEEINKFVRHQGEKNWIGKNSFYKTFYADLATRLRELKKMAEDNGLIPDGMSKNERAELFRVIEGRLAFEYIQHLVAAGLLKNAEQDKGRR